jgi:hypothetical protein
MQAVRPKMAAASYEVEAIDAGSLVGMVAASRKVEEAIGGDAAEHIKIVD